MSMEKLPPEPQAPQEGALFVQKTLNEKLLEAQRRIGAISKDSTNPFFKSKYFDINQLVDEVKPVMNSLGLIVLQPLTSISFRPAIKTIIIDSYTGDRIEDSFPLPENTDPQKLGSIITYFRRYALQSMLFLSAEDDDANSARPQASKTAPQSVPQPRVVATQPQAPQDPVYEPIDDKTRACRACKNTYKVNPKYPNTFYCYPCYKLRQTPAPQPPQRDPFDDLPPPPSDRDLFNM